jgi:hypothetical protein
MGMKRDLQRRIDEYNMLLLFFNEQLKDSETTGRKGFCTGRKGFCGAINEVFGIDAYLPSIFENNFPELWSLRPNIPHDTDYWFDRSDSGMKQRIDLVNKAIEITQEKLNTFNSLKTA